MIDVWSGVKAAKEMALILSAAAAGISADMC